MSAQTKARAVLEHSNTVITGSSQSLDKDSWVYLTIVVVYDGADP